MLLQVIICKIQKWPLLFLHLSLKLFTKSQKAFPVKSRYFYTKYLKKEIENLSVATVLKYLVLIGVC